MLKQRIDDGPFLRLIKKWLKAGILEEDGKVIHPVTGTPQGGIVSPVLANVYLHYVLDLWFERVMRRYCHGMVYLCRYADDFVCLFEHKADAERFYRELPGRLAKFNLELSAEKTRIVHFSRFPESAGNYFEFLGFRYSWGDSRKGKRIVRLETSSKKFRQSLANFTEWCRTSRSMSLRAMMRTLNSKLRGYYNYFGVIGNYRNLGVYFHQIRIILKKWLNRRSQRRSFNWQQFDRMLERHKIERPRITERRDVQLSFSF